MRIKVQREVLTDRSEVFNVVLYADSTAPAITFHAYTERDAHEMADDLVALVDRHTADKVWS